MPTWLSDVVKDRARRHALRAALDFMDARYGTVSADEADKLVSEMRKKSILVRPCK